MAGENAIQFNIRPFADTTLTYGSNPAFGMNADNIPVNTSDTGTRQIRLQFQDTKSENVPQKMQDIASDNKIGKSLDALAMMNKTFFNK